MNRKWRNGMVVPDANVLAAAVQDAREMSRCGRPFRKAYAEAAARHGLATEALVAACLMPAKVQLRCNGRLHALLVTPKGQIACLHHTKAEAVRLLRFAEIGGDLCPCLRAVKLFREATSGSQCRSRLPMALRPSAALIQEGRRKKALEAPAQAVSNRPWTQRPEGLKRMIDRVLHDRLGLPRHVRAVVTLPERRGEEGVYDLRVVSGAETLMAGRLRADWEETVRRRGIAAATGGLVVECGRIPAVPSGHVLLWRPTVMPDGAVRFRSECFTTREWNRLCSTRS